MPPPAEGKRGRSTEYYASLPMKRKNSWATRAREMKEKHIMTQTDPNMENKQGYQYQEELQVMGEQLVSKVKELIHEGNVRRIIIKQDGHSIMEFPLTVGLVGVIV